MSRVLPTAPGWWWMRRLYTSGPTKPQAVEVIRAYDGVLVVRQDIEVAHPRFDWLEPIPAPGALVGKVYAGEVLRDHITRAEDGVGMSVALPLGTAITIGARVRVYVEEAP